jgi:hypothetical protein
MILFAAERNETNMAPVKRDASKRPVTFWLNAELHAKFSHLVKERGDSMSELLTRFIEEVTKTVQLDPKEAAELDAWFRNKGLR